jgi:hypothetical protein
LEEEILWGCCGAVVASTGHKKYLIDMVRYKSSLMERGVG